MIQKRSTGTPLGAIRINRIHKQWRWGEIGYDSDPEFWGRGLMTEAVRAVVACGRGHVRLNRMEAWTLPGNDVSNRVLVKAGFNYERTRKKKAWFNGAFHDFRMFGVQRLTRSTKRSRTLYGLYTRRQRNMKIGFRGEELLRLRDAAQGVAADRNQPASHSGTERVGEARRQQQILLD